MRKASPIVLAFIAAVTCVAARTEDVIIKTPPIGTRCGPVIGELRDDVCIFRGIPYAGPPVGDSRWGGAVLDSWKSPRECLKFGPVCPQPTTEIYGDLGASSEDCLYLNVWTSAKITGGRGIANEKRPVLFWIHGGDFAVGAGSQPWYEGSQLARDGAVVVTINYRLGPFGFLAHPALSRTQRVSGNYGLHDICTALSWTKMNIANFGGDPANITVMGEGTGGAAIFALMATHSYYLTDPFHRAIVMSTNTYVPLRMLDDTYDGLQSMEELGVEFQKRLNVADGPDVVQEMRAKSTAEILNAARPISAVPGVSTTDSICVDGSFIRHPFLHSYSWNTTLHIPLMIGNVADEGFMFQRKLKYDSVAKYKELLAQNFGRDAGAVFNVYPAASDADVKGAMTDLFSDIFYRSTRLHARSLICSTPNVFVYQFARKGKPMVDSGWGVYHGSELPYFFGNVQDPNNYSDDDRELSRLIRIYILNFARTGNANAAGDAPKWPAYRRQEEPHLILDSPTSTGSRLHEKTLDALQNANPYPGL